MDDQRFDSLVRSLASGANRRSVLKRLLGLGGAAVAGSIATDTQAARRPAPTPKPLSCPGQQTAVQGECVCQPPKAPGNEKCGPSCCNPEGIGAAHTECCDQACCAGHCYGEELCCPYPREFCEITGDCCPEGWTCCPDFGCIAPDQCCTDIDCPLRECFAAFCASDHYCAYGDDCFNGANCCETDFCLRSDCQEGGSCAEPVPDCRNNYGGEINCCGDGVCQENGVCCTPSCPAGTCGGDGCGGECFCPDGQVCSGGGCFVPCDSNPQNACPHCSVWQCLPTNGGTAHICIAPPQLACTPGVECPAGTYCAAGYCAQPCS